MQPLLPPPILLLLGVVLFGSGEAARFRNYQKHGGGEVCSSSFHFPLLLLLHHLHITILFLLALMKQSSPGTTRSMAVDRHALLHSLF